MSRLQTSIKSEQNEVSDVLTEEILANSEIEGVFLDRDSVHSSFVKNISPLKKTEQGAIALTKTALESFQKPLTHQLLKSMHRKIMQGSDFPDSSIGQYMGDMQIVSGNRLDREPEVVHQGVSKELVKEKMSEFIACFNNSSPDSPLVNAIRGHVHFEALHPFCDGNGRIGRSLILMGLCRDFNNQTPLALSRVFQRHSQDYYRQFQAPLDLTETIKSMAPHFITAIETTQAILELTAFRAKVSQDSEQLNPRQLKVLHRLIDYELRSGFEGGLNNAKYQKMTDVGDRTALRDLKELSDAGFLLKTGKLKGTRYHLNTPSIRAGVEG